MTDWPHDPDGDAGSEGGRKYGMAIIAKKVDGEDFPVSVGAFLEAHAADPVRLNAERLVSVGDIFEHVDGETFEDWVAFHGAVGDAMRRGGFWDYHPVGADPETKRA